MCDPISKYLPVSLQDNSEKTAFLALAGCVSFALVSVAISEILLAVTIAAFIWMWKKHRLPTFPRLGFYLPLAFFIAWTLAAVLASSNVILGLLIIKKFYLFLLMFMVPFVVAGEGRLLWIYRAIFTIAVVSSGLGLIQYAANPKRDLLHRISGFMSQWMTYSGLLMLVLVLLTAYALCIGVRKHIWVVPVAALVAFALLFSQTRNAWVGALGGVIALILMRRPRAIPILLALILAFALLSPESIKQRFRSGLDPTDPNTRNRIELFETSIRLIRDNPWFGVGPKNVKYEALKYRGDNNQYPDWMYQHMHNNCFQIAAETGLPGIILWLWLMFRLAWDALRCYRSSSKPSFPGSKELRKEALMASSAALAAWIALMIAGMAEYNFGDSEVLMLFLFIISSPYAFLIQNSETSQRAVQNP